jgi:hypothetical protein
MGTIPLGGRRGRAGALAGLCLLALAACSTPEPPISLSGAGGSVTLNGTWMACPSASGSYTKVQDAISSDQLSSSQWSGLALPDCSDATGTAPFTLTATITVTGVKSVSFSTDGVTADADPPAGVTQPADAPEMTFHVTASSDPSLVQQDLTDLWYPVANLMPTVIYRGIGTVEADGFPPFLSPDTPLTRK